MDRKVAKEFLHIRDWLSRAGDIVNHGREAYQDDTLLPEAGDSLMMKLGEAAGRLASANIEPPDGVIWTEAIANRYWLIHQYDEIDRALTWALTWETLAGDRASWRAALARSVADAEASLETRA